MIKNLPQHIKKDIELHSLEENPHECCGIITLMDNKYELTRCNNEAENKKSSFRISAKDYLLAKKLGDIVAYYHSHAGKDDAEFSDMDKKNSEGHKLPLLLYNIESKELIEYIP
jgi:proteasome lid subunit RPN8/RPN11